ncbi:CGNR zinc finger domain-containing protein [Tunturiibacter lichenicola]|uniref:CGNR zinc finger domain-containing protein n=1 Tax=Tunturiibacter lichenicola TaxID=2051959 RepID=UPI0021B46240|nr:CGNR zinc finger domain-containing protein [Edaphobacter lichenicola]
MKTKAVETEYVTSPIPSVGDHPAINFINTLRMIGGELTDTWQSDADVAAWIVQEGLRDAIPSTTWPVGVLLRKTRSLRELALRAVEARKAKKAVPLDELNGFLEHSDSHCVLQAKTRTDIQFERVYGQKTVEQYLAPVAESVAELLSHGDFDLIRHCEGAHCVLWFYDRTKAHRRRWCSPQTCGNRSKVAAFRARAKE